MKLVNNKLITASAGALWVLLANVSANAEDIELFLGTDLDSSNETKPNILLILDDSGSMGSEVLTQNNYDPSVSYSGNCRADRVYWTTGSSPPSCWTDNYIELSSFVCRRALDAFDAMGGGTYFDTMAQYDPRWQDRWERISDNYHDRLVECMDDLPDPSSGWDGHGDGSNSDEVYPRNDNDSQLWTSDPNHPDRVYWNQYPADRSYTVYHGNYLNWYYAPGTLSTRIEVMKDVATNLINAVSGVNIGLMSFNYDDGGRVRHAIQDVGTSRSSLLSAVDNLDASGWTPLSETLYEAHQYLRASKVVYGSNGDDDAFDPNDDSQYLTPIEYTCQKNHIVLLTDGEPTRDYGANDEIVGLNDAEGNSFSALTGSSTCDVESYPAELNPDGGVCLDDLAHFMYEGDMSPMAGQQNVTTHTVGFLIDLPVLKQAAARGGGDYYTADDTATLTTALTSIITNILRTQSTFVAPSVSVNAFNQTRNLNDLYFSVFQPSGTTHWPGNLKKYRLRGSDGMILDADGNPAVDQSTGFFADTARSFWTPSTAGPDGPEVEAGGAANLIPDPRTVFTYLGNSDLTAAGNRVETANADITDAMLNTGNAGDPSRDEVIAFMNGLDASDVDQDGDLTEPRYQMGDPLHARPATVIYGPTNDDGRIYFATNNGYLHSIDTETGVEQWAFVPTEFLGSQVDFFRDNSAANKLYGIDGSMVVQSNANHDNMIDAGAGEKVYLFFGMRRGGDFYYGLDVSDPDRPEFMWRLDGTDLPGVGQSWSPPSPARINIGGTEKMVLVIGGGYDPSQDDFSASVDGSGNAIYIVDSETGNLLWHASNQGADLNLSTANGNNATMEYSIPASVKVVDIDSDGLADRLYAADMGGQVWRFDIYNGNPASSLATGGAIAQLGAAGLATPGFEDTRRFYNSPDTAFVSTEEQTFMHVGIGSGHRAHPNSLVNHDRFYAIRDYSAFKWLTQAQFDAWVPFVDGDFVDVADDIDADVPIGSAGWKYELRNGGWRGEKVLAEAVTFDGEVFFNTFRPGTSGSNCNPSLGVTRQYRVSVFNGGPVTNLDGPIDEDGDGEPDPLTHEDRYEEEDGTILSRTTIIFEDDGTVGCTETDCSNLNFNPSPRRTFWTQESVQ